MSNPNKIKKVAKYIDYILGRNPFEFGLVPDESGFVKIKDLLKVLGEEDGYRSIRESHFNEIILSHPNPPIELDGTHIRAKKRLFMYPDQPILDPPKELYAWTRRKAHTTVLEKGLRPSSHPMVVLASEKAIAQRIGSRIDTEPLIFIINVQNALDQHIDFHHVGGALYLAPHIPSNCFVAPPKPKEIPIKDSQKPNKTPQPKPAAGAYYPSIENTLPGLKRERPRGKDKKIDWKITRRKKQKSGI
jgi:putative RNA 2'-phosphotransferase